MQKNTVRQDWMAKATAAAKGKAFDADAALHGRLEGPRAFRAEVAPWKIFARLDHVDVARAKAQAEDDLSHGADGLILTAADGATVLDQLPLHAMALRNDAGELGAEAIRLAVQRQPVDPQRLATDFGLTGAALVPVLQEQGFAGPFLRGDGRPWHAMGCNDAEELGAALAQAIAGLRKLEVLDDAALSRAVSLTLSATQNMFATLAKFRAARLLWSGILKASHLPDAPLALHGETSRVMLAETDAHSNILRGVAAVFGAGLGGADSICVLPHSFNQGLPNSFARRVARNMQTLLQHESHLWRVRDPAAGAGAIEQRTDALCEQAWAVMQACERGTWPAARSEPAARPIIGVSKYPNPKPLAADVEGVS